ncbi:hypothetical protein [Agrobacterium rubi]|uniref:Uncharacterized protein n=2 Tax=Agrobacterium rubi TaxID=28099 RepID=A0AAE7UPU4_9HYPH|nr:hypothetical protein [Agrobacterium rubi]MBP1877158.1 hypothetical protein [Agrobacterium rubi]MCL6651342.1 hypothetical protein [Agrobacterium rubi]NTE87017.1 hypothetical protein [Agrobacterium rubi]NTF02951.1 hypothetical protein [Agrobacterium rubi]NTF08151.1 hypothetical protein [Agrobacterium rubi]
MSACAMLTFNNVTPAIWQCGVESASKLGVTITGNSGSASKSGFTVSWNYDPQAQTCQIQCTDSPWVVPCSIINSTITNTVEACYTQNSAVMKEMVGA